jgi:Ca2+-binding RTX toxin-like protein
MTFKNSLGGRRVRAAWLGLAALGAAGAVATQGLGAPAATCFGERATVSGSGTITGTQGNDVIVGSAGDDMIDGSGGNDRICGLDGHGEDK